MRKRKKTLISIVLTVVFMMLVINGAGCFSGTQSSGDSVDWIMNDITTGIEKAKESDKLILLDFWGAS